MWKQVLRELWADEAAEAIGDFALVAAVTVVGVIATLTVVAEVSFDFWSLVVGIR